MKHNWDGNKLKTEKLTKLLTAMNCDLSESQLTFSDDVIIIHSNAGEQTWALTSKLESLFGMRPEFVSSKQLVLNDIKNASDSVNKSYCEALFGLMPLQVSQLPSDDFFSFSFPSPQIADMFSSLQYEHITIEGTTLKYNLQHYLQEDKLLILDQNALFFSPNAIKSKVYYAEKPLADGSIEVTPHVVFPEPENPPHYHLVLDVSGSMKEERRLEQLQDSVIKFAEAIFAYYPAANIYITVFSHYSASPRLYQKQGFENLKNYINGLTAEGGTSLFDAVLKKITMLESSTVQNNILLFTDGLDTSTGKDRERLTEKINSLQSQTTLTTKNKFCLISYLAAQPPILNQLTQTFGSDVVKTNSIELMNALSSTDKLLDWASARDLLTCRYTVAENSTTETIAVNFSGQIEALTPRILTPDSPQLHLQISDSNGNTLIEDTHAVTFTTLSIQEETILEEKKPSNAQILSNIGQFGHSSELNTDVNVPEHEFKGLGLNE